MSVRTALPLLLFGALASVTSAGTLTVGPPGSGADFDEIGDAVTAALPGDLILVTAGQYVDVGTIVVDKPLTILGAGSITTSFEAVGASPTDRPLPLHVTDLPAGDEVRIAGLRLLSGALGGAVESAVVVEDCQGPVILSDVAGGGLGTVFGTQGLCVVRNSNQVTLDGCLFSATFGGGAQPTPGLVVDDSRVYVNACTIVGGSPPAPFIAMVAFDGAPGILATNSVVRLSRSTVTGGRGTLPSLFFTPTNATAGGAAVEAVTSHVYVRGGQDNSLQGGAGGVAFDGGQNLYGAGGPALAIPAGSLASTTIDVVAAGGFDGSGSTITPAVVGAGTWLPLPEALATMESAAKLVAPGGTVNLELGGEAASIFRPYFSFDQADALSVPGIYGEVLLALGAVVPLTPATLDGNGRAGLDVPVPNQPALVGLTILVQGLATGPSGQASFSAPTFVGLRY